MNAIKSFGYKGILWIWFDFNVKIMLNNKVMKAWLWFWKHDYLSSKLCLSRAKCTHVIFYVCQTWHGNTFLITGPLYGESSSYHRRPVMNDFPGVFLISLDKRLHKHLSYLWAVYVSQRKCNHILVFIMFFLFRLVIAKRILSDTYEASDWTRDFIFFFKRW